MASRQVMAKKLCYGTYQVTVACHCSQYMASLLVLRWTEIVLVLDLEEEASKVSALEYTSARGLQHA